jgi:hypothetical protein
VPCPSAAVLFDAAGNAFTLVYGLQIPVHISGNCHALSTSLVLHVTRWFNIFLDSVPVTSRNIFGIWDGYSSSVCHFLLVLSTEVGIINILLLLLLI